MNSMVEWLNDNRMVLSPFKTKLILSCTKELRAKRYSNISFSIKFNNQIINPTPSEKLLGVVLDQDISWTAYLWGETWRYKGKWPGLVPTLTKRLGLLKHLARLSSKKKMKEFIPGIFTSRLRYALPLVGSIWGTQSYVHKEPHKYSFIKSDLHDLQSLQRKAALLVTDKPAHHLQSTEVILKEVDWLSVNQLIASTSLTGLHRMMRSGVPRSLQNCLKPSHPSRTSYKNIELPLARLNLTS